MRLLLAIAIGMSVAYTSLRTEPSGEIQPLNVDNPILLGSFETEVEIPSKSSSAKGRALWGVLVWSTSQTTIEYSIDATTVVLDGQPSVFSEYTTEEIFDHIAVRTVLDGIDSAYASCSTTPTSTGVTLTRCVIPGSGAYAIYDANLVRRGYSFTCSSVTLTSTTNNATCGGGSQATSGASGLE